MDLRKPMIAVLALTAWTQTDLILGGISAIYTVDSMNHSLRTQCNFIGKPEATSEQRREFQEKQQHATRKAEQFEKAYRCVGPVGWIHSGVDYFRGRGRN